MTETEARVLKTLSEKPTLTSSLYAIIWPDGRYATRDPGTMGGGPSRGEVAVNFFMQRGEMKRLTQRQRSSYKGREYFVAMHELTYEGRRALEQLNRPCAESLPVTPEN
jgi:hypothetical protein